MRTLWENEGNPNEEGEYVAVIDMEDGSGVQRFKGKSHLEVANQLLNAQANATVKIRQFARTETPDPAVTSRVPQPRVLSADERMQVAQDITDPARAPEAIKRVVEASVGFSLEDISTSERERRIQEEKDKATATCKRWAADNPDYYECQRNGIAMGRYLQLNSMAVTEKNLNIAFEDLREAGLLLAKPEQTEEPGDEPEIPESQRPGGLPANQSAVRTRPRGQGSTGLRAGDSSAGGGVESRASARQKYTRQDIEQMSQRDYDFKISNEPGFREFVDKLGSKVAAR